MFNNEVILTIAQAILANTKVIQSLVDHLPAEVREKVASVVVPVAAVAPVIPKPVPVVVEPAPIIVAPVAVAPVVAPVVAAPVLVAAPVMPAPPVFAAPVAAPVVSGAAPFDNPKGLIDFVMGSYKALGPVKGAGIQGVLTGLGYQNINDVNPAHYGALFSGIEALKA
jgi:hypothetical protein